MSPSELYREYRFISVKLRCFQCCGRLSKQASGAALMEAFGVPGPEVAAVGLENFAVLLGEEFRARVGRRRVVLAVIVKAPIRAG